MGTAIVCGLLIGIERGFNLRHVAEGTRIAGVRTFTLLGLIAGIAGLVGSFNQTAAAGALMMLGRAQAEIRSLLEPPRLQ